MSYGNQTDTITCLDEQKRMPGFDSASTDLDVLEIVIEWDPLKIDDKADTKFFDLESHETARGFLDWTEIAATLEGQIITQSLDLRSLRLSVREPTSDPSRIKKQIFISGGYLSQAQSDLVVLGEKEKQPYRTDTAYIEKISQVDVTDKVESIFRAVAEEALEGEIEDEFAKSLSELIGQYEGNAVNEIQHFILKKEITPELAEATLRILGDLEHTLTHNYRRWLLEKALIEGSSPIVRDGANVGLAYMDDPHAIPFFKNAIQKERNFLLRKVMNKTLFQLEGKQKCQSSCTVQSLTNG